MIRSVVCSSEVIEDSTETDVLSCTWQRYSYQRDRVEGERKHVASDAGTPGALTLAGTPALRPFEADQECGTALVPLLQFFAVCRKTKQIRSWLAQT